MASAAVQMEEEALIREQIAQVELPEGVRLKNVEPMTEWTGEPAWSITFAASTKVPLTKRRLADFRRVQSAVEDRIFSLHLEKYPFIWFTDGK